MSKLSFIFTALLLSQIAFAQDQAVELSSRNLDNRNIEITYQKNKPGNFTVALKFNSLTNVYQSPEGVYNVISSSGTLLTLKPQNTDQGIGYSYNYRYIRGKLKPKIRKDFCYVLPYVPGTKVKVVESGYVNEKYFGAERPSDWKSYSMFTDQQDTVIAIRKGLVVEIIDKYQDKSEKVEYTSERNQIIVEQEDGSLLRYSGLEGGSITVKLGETIFPGTPIGMNTSAQNSFYQVSLLLYYLNSVNFESLKGQTLSSPKSLYEIITPRFTTSGNACGLLENKQEYTAVNSEEIITQEMSKKELKKYYSQKGE